MIALIAAAMMTERRLSGEGGKREMERVRNTEAVLLSPTAELPGDVTCPREDG